MWYNDILIILMGFLALLMILMALLVSLRARKPKPIETIEEKPERVYVEKGFEKQVDLEEEQKDEDENNTTYIESEPITIDETESRDSEPIETPPPNEDVVITPTEPIIIEEASKEPLEPNAERTLDEDLVITPVETIIIEPEPETGSITESEPYEDVIITPNATIYNPKQEEIEEATDEEDQNPLEKEEVNIEDIPKVELSPLEPKTEAEPVISILEGNTESRRLRKPVIDESDPELKVDLGVKTCLNCGATVPDTIYCILCGKQLDPDNAIDCEEEEEN